MRSVGKDSASGRFSAGALEASAHTGGRRGHATPVAKGCYWLHLATRSVFRNSSRGLRVRGLEICCAEMGGRAATSFHRILIRANRADTDSSVYINNPLVCKRRHFRAVSFVEDALINRHRQSYPST